MEIFVRSLKIAISLLTLTVQNFSHSTFFDVVCLERKNCTDASASCIYRCGKKYEAKLICVKGVVVTAAVQFPTPFRNRDLLVKNENCWTEQ